MISICHSPWVRWLEFRVVDALSIRVQDAAQVPYRVRGLTFLRSVAAGAIRAPAAGPEPGTVVVPSRK